MKLSGPVLLVVVMILLVAEAAARAGHPEFRLPLVSAALAAALLGIVRAFWKRGGGSDFHDR